LKFGGTKADIAIDDENEEENDDGAGLICIYIPARKG
jgi:hypothetical protein